MYGLLGRIEYQKWIGYDSIGSSDAEIIAEKVGFLSRMEKTQAEPKTKGKKAKVARLLVADSLDEMPFS